MMLSKKAESIMFFFISPCSGGLLGAKLKIWQSDEHHQSESAF